MLELTSNLQTRNAKLDDYNTVMVTLTTNITDTNGLHADDH